MRGEEFDDFVSELKQLCASLGKAFTDALAQAYWRALKDIPLDELQANVERILLNAKAETKFPKPSALRSSPPPAQAANNDPQFRAAEDTTIRNLEQMRQTNPDEWVEYMTRHKGPDCNAIRLHRRYGSRLLYDLTERCWRLA